MEGTAWNALSSTSTIGNPASTSITMTRASTPVG